VYAENDNLTECSRVQDFFGRLSRAMGVETVSYPGAASGERHCHPHAELLYADSGAVKITTPHASWVVPPHRAAWFPPGCDHQADTLGAAEVCRVYIHPLSCPEKAPRKACLLQTSSLLRELARRAAEIPQEYDEQGRDGRLMALLLDEIDWTPAREVTMPRFRDARLTAIEEAFVANPGDRRTIDEWAAFAGASTRNLARLFEREGGMTFRQWREQFRALAAIPRLVNGESITILASEFGYETPGAFTAMFRRVIGMPPSQYMAEAIKKQPGS
jgi:AraC-like DNA-binding protein/quercetin dioxygenase-like cupin family protein